MTEMAATAAPGRAGFDFRISAVVGIWMRHVRAFKRGWHIELTGIIVEPVFVLAAIGFGIGRFVGEFAPGVSYAEFVTPGIIAGTAMFHALFECSWGAYRRMETHRIYESVLTAPVTVSELALGEISWGATRAVMTAAAVLAFAAGLGLVGSPWGIAVVLVGVFIGLIFGGMGLIFAALAPSTHAFTLVFTVVATPLYFFSGSFFPIASLPGYLQPLAWALPLTPAVHISRAFATGEFDVTHLYSALYMAALAGMFYPLAVRLLKRRLLV